MCGNKYSLNGTIGRDVRTRKFQHLHLRHFACLPHHYRSLENSRTFQDLEIVPKKIQGFPGLSRSIGTLCDMCQTWIANIEGWPVLNWLVHVSSSVNLYHLQVFLYLRSLSQKEMYGECRWESLPLQRVTLSTPANSVQLSLAGVQKPRLSGLSWGLAMTDAGTEKWYVETPATTDTVPSHVKYTDRQRSELNAYSLSDFDTIGCQNVPSVNGTHTHTHACRFSSSCDEVENCTSQLPTTSQHHVHAQIWPHNYTSIMSQWLKADQTILSAI